MRRVGLSVLTVLVMSAFGSLAGGAMVDDVVIEYWAGASEGDYEAIVVVDFAPGSNFAFGYRWNDGETPTGWDALSAIDAAGGEGTTTEVDRATKGEREHEAPRSRDQIIGRVERSGTEGLEPCQVPALVEPRQHQVTLAPGTTG